MKYRQLSNFWTDFWRVRDCCCPFCSLSLCLLNVRGTHMQLFSDYRLLIMHSFLFLIHCYHFTSAFKCNFSWSTAIFFLLYWRCVIIKNFHEWLAKDKVMAFIFSWRSCTVRFITRSLTTAGFELCCIWSWVQKFAYCQFLLYSYAENCFGEIFDFY